MSQTISIPAVRYITDDAKKGLMYSSPLPTQTVLEVAETARFSRGIKKLIAKIYYIRV